MEISSCSQCEHYHAPSFRCMNVKPIRSVPLGVLIPDWCPLLDSKDDVNHPEHYTSHPSGIECIQVTEHMGFCLGNAVKYIWRADLKKDAIKDLRKAIWYIEREIERRGQ